MRILLDTNVLIAAFIARGLCKELLEHCIEQHTLITSEFILSEFREKLRGKFNYNSEDAEEAAALIMTSMEIVKPINLDEPICRDSDDDNVLAAAVSGACKCIITGDKDILILKLYKGIDILSPGDFQKYEEENQ